MVFGPFVAPLVMSVSSALFRNAVCVFQSEKGSKTKGQQHPPASSWILVSSVYSLP